MSDPPKSCPFCGGKNVVANTNGDRPRPFWVLCMSCGAYGPAAETVEDARRLWESRA